MLYHIGPAKAAHGYFPVAHLKNISVNAGPNSAALLFPGNEEYFCFSKTCETHHAWLHLALPDLAPPISERIKSLATAPEMIEMVAGQLLWRFVGKAEHPFINC